MKVYRYLDEEELNNILSGNIDKIGKEYSRHAKGEVNTHKYKEGEKYLHFFKDKKGCEEISIVMGKGKNYYVCEFNIPFRHLLFRSGKGYYVSHGYDSDYETFKEYILETSKFKSEYLTSYTLFKDSNEQEREM